MTAEAPAPEAQGQGVSVAGNGSASSKSPAPVATGLGLAALMPQVAERVFRCPPNPRFCTKSELRWGTKGSVSIDLGKGTFYDHEQERGGGVLDLLRLEMGFDKPGALAWLRQQGLLADERAPSRSTFYDYQEPGGDVRYRVERIGTGAVKGFRQWGPDGEGGFRCARGCMAGVEPLPYRLPDWNAADAARPVFIVEGEKDADRLAGLGLLATCNSGGAGKFARALVPWFTGRKVVLIGDNDDAGRAHVADVARKLAGTAAAVVAVDLPGLPPKGDVSDYLDSGGIIDDLKQLAKTALIDPQPIAYDSEPIPAELPVIDLSQWLGADPPPRRFAWGERIPLHQTTLLTGTGGAGKSLFGQQLCTAVAAGTPFLGLPVRQSPALYLTAEDDADELWRRQLAICAALNAPLDDLAGMLHLVSLAGETDTAFATFDAEHRMIVTARWQGCQSVSTTNRIGLVVIDNATDTMGGDHNDLHEVAGFVNLLTGLAIETDGAVVLIHHPSKASADWLGSVSWHNKVRSRLLIEQPDPEFDPDARVIRCRKGNYSPTGSEIAFRWHHGAFVREDELPADFRAEIDQVIAASADNEIFLRCLRARAGQGEGREVGSYPGPNYAPKLFAEMPEAKGLSKDRLAKAMERLFALGAIEAVTVKRPGKSATKTIIVEVPNPPRTRPEPVQPSPEPLPNDPLTPPNGPP